MLNASKNTYQQTFMKEEGKNEETDALEVDCNIEKYCSMTNSKKTELSEYQKR